MYADHVIHGPYIRMKPAPNYKEYVYLTNFNDPYTAFNGLKGFPHVVYTALTCGDWNTLIITNRLLDFSRLTGFERMVNQSVRYCSHTPKTEYMTWVEGFQRVYEQLDRFQPTRNESRNRQLTYLDWGENEWKLFYAFNFMRKKVTPVLRKIHVGYETYTKWIKSLESHCTIHTGFYPQGYESYTSHCFLLYTDYEESVKSLFSLFLTTSFIIELEKQLLVFAHVISPEVKRNLICLIYDMKTKKMIKGFKQAVILSHSHATQSLFGSRNY